MYPQGNIVRYEVPARAGMGPVKVHVYDNVNLLPEIMKDAEKKYEFKFHEDTLFVGDKGLFRTGGACGSLGFLPEDRRTEVPEPPKVLPRAPGAPSRIFSTPARTARSRVRISPTRPRR
jgi:hypothetical protein